MSALSDRKVVERERLEEVFSSCCTCGTSPPCSWCMALAEDEAGVFSSQGRDQLNDLLRQKFTTLNDDEGPWAVLILPFGLVIESTTNGDRIAVMDVAGQEVYIIPRGDFDEEAQAFSDVTRVDVLRVHDSKLASITPAMIEDGGMPKVDTMHGLEHAALLALLGGPAEPSEPTVGEKIQTALDAEVLHARVTRIKAHTPNAELQALLCIIAELHESALVDCYGIRREDDSPLDKAIYAWRDAGCRT